MSNALAFFFCCLVWSLLIANGVERFTPYYAILLVKMAGDFGLLWFFRLKRGPLLSHVERQVLRVTAFFWILAFLTTWWYQRTGGAATSILPAIVLEVAFAYSCAATILGGSFYPTAAAFVGIAIMQTLWPRVGVLFMAFGALALFWVGWKHARHAGRNGRV